MVVVVTLSSMVVVVVVTVVMLSAMVVVTSAVSVLSSLQPGGGRPKVPSGLQEQLRERTSWLGPTHGMRRKELGRTRGYRAAKCYACSSTWCLTLLALMPSSETDARKQGPCTLTCAALQVQILEFSRDETVSYTAKADLLLLHRNRASSVVIVVLACTFVLQLS